MNINYEQLRAEFIQQVDTDEHESHIAALDRSALIVISRPENISEAQPTSDGLTRGQRAAQTRARNEQARKDEQERRQMRLTTDPEGAA